MALVYFSENNNIPGPSIFEEPKSFVPLPINFWPILLSINILTWILSFLLFIHFFEIPDIYDYLIISTIINSFFWIYEILSGYSSGIYCNETIFRCRLAIIFFIISEILLFFSFFWAWFHFLFTPSELFGNRWPPHLIQQFVINPFGIPLLNTVVLILSGFSLSFANQSLLKQKRVKFIWGTAFTLYLGIYFIWNQLIEFQLSACSINTTVYNSIFYILVGFHGFHVFIGMCLISLNYFRGLYLNDLNGKNNLSLIGAIWYWHFVDGIWILLYLTVYISGCHKDCNSSLLR
uniref:Cytochrome c oxidase subunit 3 n=1 Tax=Phagocata gracilis TaxID=1354672 RepID=A0A0C4ZJY7_9PLAT